VIIRVNANEILLVLQELLDLVVIVYTELGTHLAPVYVIVISDFVIMVQVVMEHVHVIQMPMDLLVNPANVLMGCVMILLTVMVPVFVMIELLDYNVSLVPVIFPLPAVLVQMVLDTVHLVRLICGVLIVTKNVPVKMEIVKMDLLERVHVADVFQNSMDLTVILRVVVEMIHHLNVMMMSMVMVPVPC
jgi:hypothetical protein